MDHYNKMGVLSDLENPGKHGGSAAAIARKPEGIDLLIFCDLGCYWARIRRQMAPETASIRTKGAFHVSHQRLCR
jgi:hypothetical protein